MIFVHGLPFATGSDEWEKFSKLINGVLLVFFEDELAIHGIENIEECNVKSKDFYKSFSEGYAPRSYSYIKANQVVIGAYMLIKEDGYFIPDLDMRYVIDRIINNNADLLRESKKSTVLHICEEQRGEYLECFKRLYESEGYGDDEYDADEDLTWFEDVANYQDIVFEDMDYLFYDKISDDKIRNSRILQSCGVVNPFNEYFEYIDVFTGKKISYLTRLNKKKAK